MSVPGGRKGAEQYEQCIAVLWGSSALNLTLSSHSRVVLNLLHWCLLKLNYLTVLVDKLKFEVRFEELCIQIRFNTELIYCTNTYNCTIEKSIMYPTQYTLIYDK